MRRRTAKWSGLWLAVLLLTYGQVAVAACVPPALDSIRVDATTMVHDYQSAAHVGAVQFPGFRGTGSPDCGPALQIAAAAAAQSAGKTLLPPAQSPQQSFRPRPRRTARIAARAAPRGPAGSGSLHILFQKFLV